MAKDKKREIKRDVESYKRHEGLARVGKSGRSEFIGSKGPKLVRTRAANAKKAITKCARGEQNCEMMRNDEKCLIPLKEI